MQMISIVLILILTYKLTWPSTVLAKVHSLFHFASIFSSCSNETCNNRNTCSIQKKVCDTTTHRLKDYERQSEIRQPSKHLNEDQQCKPVLRISKLLWCLELHWYSALAQVINTALAITILLYINNYYCHLHSIHLQMYDNISHESKSNYIYQHAQRQFTPYLPELFTPRIHSEAVRQSLPLIVSAVTLFTITFPRGTPADWDREWLMSSLN